MQFVAPPQLTCAYDVVSGVHILAMLRISEALQTLLAMLQRLCVVLQMFFSLLPETHLLIKLTFQKTNHFLAKSNLRVS